MAEHTTARLAAALQEIPGVPGEMIEAARSGYYDEYTGPLDTPLIQLVTDLRDLASRPATPRNSRPLLRQMAQRVIDGEFDASKEESDAWAASPEGQQTFAELAKPSTGAAASRRQLADMATERKRIKDCRADGTTSPPTTGPGPEDDASDVIRIKSTSDPDGEPACEITWGALQWCAPVADVRETAVDLVTCAAYAEMMMTLIVQAELPAAVASQLTTQLLSGREKRYFGAKTTMTLLPAGSSKRQQALVLLKRGTLDAALSPDEARMMALHWLEVAEATESDQLVSEALRANGVAVEAQEVLFGYLRELRSAKERQRA